MPSYSVIIPAYNEEKLLPYTLHALRSAMHELGQEGEIILVDNNSTDATPSIGMRFGASVIFEPINQISRARNAGAKVAVGDALIFLDADSQISPRLLETALRNLDTDCSGGGALVALDQPVYKQAEWGLRLWNWISQRYCLAAGCFLYCLSEAFREVGGFSQSVYASEEVWLSRKLSVWGRQRGKRFEIITHSPVVTSSRKLEWYTPAQLVVLTVCVLSFPFLLRSKKFCAYWYNRPGKS